MKRSTCFHLNRVCVFRLKEIITTRDQKQDFCYNVSGTIRLGKQSIVYGMKIHTRMTYCVRLKCMVAIRKCRVASSCPKLRFETQQFNTVFIHTFYAW